MAIEFRCGQCGRLLRTGDDTAGRMAQCPVCGTQTPVPVRSEEPLITPIAVEPNEADASAPPPSGTPFGAGPATLETGENPYQSPHQNGQISHSQDPYRVQATASLVFGIVGVVLSIACCVCAPVGLCVSLIGLIFGIIGLRSTTRNGFAVAGIVLSTIGMAICLLLIIALGAHPHRIHIP